jgi:hypothetical protein
MAEASRKRKTHRFIIIGHFLLADGRWERGVMLREATVLEFLKNLGGGV